MQSDLAVVLSKRKKKYGIMTDAIIKSSQKEGFAIRFKEDDLSGFKNVIIFENKLDRMEGWKIKCDRKANVGWWMNDLRDPAEMDASMLPDRVNYIFLCNRHFLKNYRKKFNRETRFMPQHGHALSMDSANVATGYDVVFIGNFAHPKYHRNRMEILRPLMKSYSVKIERGRKISHNMSRLYNSIPVSISISPPYKSYTSNRLYNILASGGFALSLYYPQMEHQFTNYHHLVWFNTAREAEKLIKYYLKHGKQRCEIAKNGFALFNSKHRAEHRLKNITDIMEEKTTQFYGYL